MRVLVTDSLYPSRLSRWRNIEIQEFLRSGADVCVFRINSFAGIDFTFDWDFANRHDILSTHSVHVLDEAYIRRILGSSPLEVRTGQAKRSRWASYAIARGRQFEIADYDVVVHIFLRNFLLFNREFKFPLNRQVVHAYPGGGFDYRVPDANGGRLLGQTNVIATHPMTSDARLGQKSIDCWTGPFFGTEESRVPADFVGSATRGNRRPFTIATASLGNPVAKGTPRFEALGEEARKRSLDLRFLMIGSEPSNPRGAVESVGMMDYVSLEQFYTHEVDVFLSLESGVEANGWPLGLEAAKAGCALLTTDALGISSRYGSDTETPTVIRNNSDLISALDELRRDSDRFDDACARSSDFVWRWGSPSAQFYRYMDFISDVMCAHQSGPRTRIFGRRRRRWPPLLVRRVVALIRRVLLKRWAPVPVAASRRR